MPLLLSFFSSKLGQFSIIGLVVVGIISYYKINIWDLSNQIKQYISDIRVLENDKSILQSNIEELMSTNMDNITALNDYKKELDKLNLSYSIIINGKDKEIQHLKLLLKDATKPVVYTKTVDVKDCKIQVKDKPDENDTTFNSINSIGF